MLEDELPIKHKLEVKLQTFQEVWTIINTAPIHAKTTSSNIL